MTFDMEATVRAVTAQYRDRLAKHRCVRCGDQHEDSYVKELCAVCMGGNHGRDWTDDSSYNDPRRGQAKGLNSLRRLP